MKQQQILTILCRVKIKRTLKGNSVLQKKPIYMKHCKVQNNLLKHKADQHFPGRG